MRTITLLVIHCSAVRPDQTSSAAQIDTWHRRDRHIRGQPADTRTEAQKAAMLWLLRQLRKAYPRACIVGHRDLSHDRDCPCFDVVEYADLQPK